MKNDIAHIVWRKCRNCIHNFKGRRAMKKVDRINILSSLGNDKNEEIIVSLTTIPSRFDKIYYTIKSIFLQTLRPDRIILYLDSDVSINRLPKNLEPFIKLGLEIESRPGNIRAHKKYFYAMKEHPKAIIITVDDDLIYPKFLIQSLYDMYTRYPKCVITARAHRITFDDNGDVVPYNKFDWEVDEIGVPSVSLMATGCAGVLYPPECLDKKYLAIELIEKLSLGNDDVYLKFVEIIARRKTVLCSTNIWRDTTEIVGSQEVALSKDNVENNKNDLYIKKCMKHFGFTMNDFMD